MKSDTKQRMTTAATEVHETSFSVCFPNIMNFVLLEKTILFFLLVFS
jgi:hypothetical protein